ncbi:MAG: folate family ECF transporter S component [Clostridiales bacterium]|nr:folate family ECF transporter S component [Clostridiales bacterium]
MQKNKSGYSIQTITFAAMLVALEIVLGNLLQIPLLGKQYSLWLLPIVAAGALMGPIPAALVGGLGDFIGAHLFPAGAYFPGFTLTNVLVGLVCGLVLHRRKASILRVVLAVAGSLLIAWLLNSSWLSMLGYVSGRGFLMWVTVRAPNYPIELVLNSLLSLAVVALLGRANHVLPAEMRLTR